MVCGKWEGKNVRRRYMTVGECQLARITGSRCKDGSKMGCKKGCMWQVTRCPCVREENGRGHRWQEGNAAYEIALTWSIEQGWLGRISWLLLVVTRRQVIALICDWIPILSTIWLKVQKSVARAKAYPSSFCGNKAWFVTLINSLSSSMHETLEYIFFTKTTRRFGLTSGKVIISYSKT